MPLSLDLEKAAGTLRLNLDKRGIRNVTAEICFDLDVSGSYRDEHEDGSTQRLLERLAPVAMVFDPDQQQDLFTFSNGRDHVHHVGMVTLDNLDGYVARHVIGKVPGWNGGTDYAPVLEANLRHFGWMAADQPKPAGGMLSRMFGSKPAPIALAPKRRSIVIFNTDGDNDPNDQSGDKDHTRRVLADSQRRGDQIYFLFVAYANGGGRFPFLKEIADKYDNTGLIVIDNLDRWCRQTDDQINDEILGDELVTWLKA